MTKSLDNGVQAFYNTVGEHFSSTRKWPWPEMLPYLSTLADNDTVLDIGCGNGRLLAGMKKRIAYTGVDFSHLLIAQAKKLHPKETFILGDILEAKTWNDLPKADALFCVAVVHHVRKKDLQFLFDQFSGHLKKNGMLYLSTWNLWQKPYLKYHLTLKSLILKIRDWDWRSIWVPYGGKHWRYCQAYTQRDLAKKLSLAGFRKQKSFFSQGKGYLDGRNIVMVYRKPA